MSAFPASIDIWFLLFTLIFKYEDNLVSLEQCNLITMYHLFPIDGIHLLILVRIFATMFKKEIGLRF